jgi:hypothetical protein
MVEDLLSPMFVCRLLILVAASNAPAGESASKGIKTFLFSNQKSETLPGYAAGMRRRLITLFKEMETLAGGLAENARLEPLRLVMTSQQLTLAPVQRLLNDMLNLPCPSQRTLLCR